MTLVRSLSTCAVACAVGVGLAAACGGPPAALAPIEGSSASVVAIGGHSAMIIGPASGSASASGSSSVDPVVAVRTSPAARIAWPVIGCLIGDAWSEALGARGEERSLDTVRRCRAAATAAFEARPDDDQALAVLRSNDPAAIERATQTMHQVDPSDRSARWAALVRATAEAMREAQTARRTVSTFKGATVVDEERVRASSPALRKQDALAHLYALEVPGLTSSARALALIIAADHLETARNIDPRIKVHAASPAFSIVFKVDAPSDPKTGDWLSTLTRAAEAAGYPVPASGASSAGREQAAFASVAHGLADKLRAAAQDMPEGEARDAIAGYADHLMAQIDELGRRRGAAASASALTSARAPSASR